MRTLPSEEALVAAYWRRLARSIDRMAGGKPKESSFLKSQAGSGVWQRVTDSKNVKPVMSTRRRRGSHIPDDRSTNSNRDRDDKRLIGRKILKRCKLVATEEPQES